MRLEYIKNVTTIQLESSKCKGCGICQVVCPHQLINISNKKAEIINKDLCIECGACMKNCPFEAIYVRAGVGCAYGVLAAKFNKKNCCNESCACE